MSRVDWQAEAQARALWPADLPVPTRPECERAARRLFRFATGRAWKNPVRFTSGNRRTRVRSHAMLLNANHVSHQYNAKGQSATIGGWVTFVQGLASSLIFNGWVARAKVMRGTQLARLEVKLIQEVLDRGWLSGILKDPVKPVPVRSTPPKSVLLLKEQARVGKRLRAWGTKRRRAELAIRKLSRRARFLERKLTEVADVA